MEKRDRDTLVMLARILVIEVPAGIMLWLAVFGLASMALAFGHVPYPGWVRARMGPETVHWAGGFMAPGWGAMAALALLSTYALVLLSRIVSGCLDGEIFTRANTRRLVRIGLTGFFMIGVRFLFGFVVGWSSAAGHPIESEIPLYGLFEVGIVPCLVPLVVAWVFHEGVRLREELDEVV